MVNGIKIVDENILKRKQNKRISELEVRTEEISNNTVEKYKGMKIMKK